jgi:hypothetical protein
MTYLSDESNESCHVIHVFKWIVLRLKNSTCLTKQVMLEVNLNGLDGQANRHELNSTT